MMTLLRRLAFLGLFMIAAVPSGWAQIGSPVALENGQALSYDGLTFTISGCTWGANAASGSSGGACSSVSGGGVTTNLNHLVLEGVQTGRDQITIEVANSTATSAALSQSLNGNQSYLNFTVTVSETPGYTTTNASGALLTAVGIDAYKTTGTSSGRCSTCTATFTTTASSTAFNTSPLSPAAAFSNTQTTQTVQTRSSAQDALSGISSSFSVTENLSIVTALHGGSNPTSTLKLNTVALKFYTTPEPASMAVLLVGLGGLAAARRRRTA